MGVFDLDQEGQKRLAEEAARNAITVDQIQHSGVTLNGYVVGTAIGEAVIPTLIMFALCAAAVSKRHEMPLGWLRGTARFIVAIGIAAAGNLALFLLFPQLASSSSFSYATIIQVAFIPLAASLISLLTFRGKSSL